MFAVIPNRVTLIVGDTVAASWKPSVVQVESVPALHGAAASADVERIILDRSVTAEEFLRLLTTLPPSIAGDVMSIRDDGSAFLSATGRGGDRVLYALEPDDVAFYIDTHELTTGGSRLAVRGKE